ncbi:MAG TPA: glycosyl hydrolase [Acidimicrobiales bacterium]|nr:glycosyl hydrolase [Acidimicrobiales bacterium]
MPETTMTATAAGSVIGYNTKTNCLIPGYSDYSFMPSLTAAEQATGVTFNCLGTFIDDTTTWAEWTSPWIDDPNMGWTAWMASDPTSRTLVIATDLVPNDVSDPDGSPDPAAWEPQCAAGEFNSYATQLAEALVSAGFGKAVIRLGQEMNGSWEPDYAGTTPAEQQQWAACFAQEVTAMRAVYGAGFQFDWDVNACVDDDDLSDLWPGDQYVDIVGVDAYDAFCDGMQPTPSGASFRDLLTEPDGLLPVTLFARSHGKPMSLPEWGCTASSAGGLGDDGFYVDGIGEWVRGIDFAFQEYFDTDDDSILPLSNAAPNTLAAYVQAFG